MSRIAKYYENLSEYKQLTTSECQVFQKLFDLIILTGTITAGNQELARSFNIRHGTLTKVLQKLEKSGLIERENARKKDDSGRWRSKWRKIYLSRRLFPAFSDGIFTLNEKLEHAVMYNAVLLEQNEILEKVKLADERKN